MRRLLKAQRRAKAARRYLRLRHNVNCIPAGVYRLRGTEGGCFEFEVGSEITFLLITDDFSLFEEIDQPTARKALTSPEDFTERYYELLGKYKGRFDPDAPITACNMPPDRGMQAH